MIVVSILADDQARRVSEVLCPAISLDGHLIRHIFNNVKENHSAQ